MRNSGTIGAVVAIAAALLVGIFLVDPAGMLASRPMILLLWAAGFIAGAIWMQLPFAVFGIKPRLDAQTAVLLQILDHLKAERPAPGRPE